MVTVCASHKKETALGSEALVTLPVEALKLQRCQAHYRCQEAGAGCKARCCDCRTCTPTPFIARCSGYVSIASRGASESSGWCQAHLLLSYLFTVCQNGRVTHSKHQRILHYLRGWLATWLRLKGHSCPSFCHFQNLWRSHLWALFFLLICDLFLSPSQKDKFKGGAHDLTNLFK